MNNRLKKSIEKVIYWNKAYRNSRKKFGETKKEKDALTRERFYFHFLASARRLCEVYEEETGKKVTQIGNLPDIEELIKEDGENLFK